MRVRITPAYARSLTLAGWGGLIAVLLCWYGWLEPPRVYPQPLVLAVLILPLLCPTRGLWRGHSYTHVWTSLLALPYFALGVDGMAAGVEPTWLAPATITTSTALFAGALLWVRAEVHRRRAASGR